MPSTRKQKAKEKRARQSDVMSDVENLDIMLGSYSRDAQVEQGNISDVEGDFESDRRQQSTDLVEGNFRSLLNTNVSENSEITAETMRAINSEISSQMSRKLDEMKSDLNLQIMDAINSAIQEKVLPSIENTLNSVKTTQNTKWDIRSDGRHSSLVGQSASNSDPRSSGRHQSAQAPLDLKSSGNRPKSNLKESNLYNRSRDSSVDSIESDVVYDMVTGAKLTPHIVPEFLTMIPDYS